MMKLKFKTIKINFNSLKLEKMMKITIGEIGRGRSSDPVGIGLVVAHFDGGEELRAHDSAHCADSAHSADVTAVPSARTVLHRLDRRESERCTTSNNTINFN